MQDAYGRNYEWLVALKDDTILQPLPPQPEHQAHRVTVV